MIDLIRKTVIFLALGIATHFLYSALSKLYRR